MKKANKTRLDNRWGCSVGHAFRIFNPPSRFNAHPRPSGASAWTFCKMRFGNTVLELRGALAAGLVIGVVLAGIMIGIAIFSPNYQSDRWYLIPIAAVGPAVLLGVVVGLTLIDSVHLEGDWVEHRILNRWVIARHPIVEFERMDSPCGVFAAVIQFAGGHKIRVPGAHLGVLGSLESELKKRRREFKRQNKPLVASGDNAPV